MMSDLPLPESDEERLVHFLRQRGLDPLPVLELGIARLNDLSFITDEETAGLGWSAEQREDVRVGLQARQMKRRGTYVDGSAKAEITDAFVQCVPGGFLSDLPTDASEDELAMMDWLCANGFGAYTAVIVNELGIYRAADLGYLTPEEASGMDMPESEYERLLQLVRDRRKPQDGAGE